MDAFKFYNFFDTFYHWIVYHLDNHKIHLDLQNENV